MSFFPLYAADRGFGPLFRLLDDFDSYSRESQSQNGHGHRSHLRSFNPKFDVRETETDYELHGELPGIERNNIQIEFSQPQTLVVYGQIERSSSASGAPADLVNRAEEKSIEAGQPQEATSASSRASSISHHATVEDEDSTAQPTPAETPETQIAKPIPQPVTKPDTPKVPAEKYWVSERSVGQFSRTFNFPTRVDQDGVTANLNNGVLSIVVPKAKKYESRRILIN